MYGTNQRHCCSWLFAAAIVVSVQVAPADEPVEVTEAKSRAWEAIDTGAFADSINHAIMIYEGKKAPYKQYTPAQIIHIAENLLAGQNGDGGWPKNKDWTRADNTSKLRGGRSSLDNRSTWSQIGYLARVYQQTKLHRYAEAATRGIGYILDEQRRSGGWRGADVEAITFNDDVMAGVLTCLKEVQEDRNLYAFVDDALLARVSSSYRKGLKCVLDCQIRVGGRLTAWGHPGIRIISRDRGDDYTKGASEGAPQATQVADRFHLIRNLHDALVRLVDRHHVQVIHAAKAAMRKAQSARAPAPITATQEPQQPRKLTRAEQLKQAARARRLQRYERVLARHRQGQSLRAIARELGIHRSTVRHWVHAGSSPERANRPYHSRADVFEQQLRTRWEAGCHNAAQLTRELTASGAKMSYNVVRRRVARWRQTKDDKHVPGRGPAPTPPSIRRPSSTRFAWILMKQDDQLRAEEQLLRAELLARCPPLTDATTLAQEFIRIIRGHHAEDLDPWIALASAQSTPMDLRRFARGLIADHAAVQAALSLPWSNGQVEGQINRLKLVKRQMYGRARFDLLRRRFLYAG